jgi:ATP synthase protein I
VTWARHHPSLAGGLTTLLAGVASAALALAVGADGAPLGALFAALLVVAFFSAGGVPLLLVGGELARAGIGFLVLMMTYVLRLVALLVVVTLAARSGAVDIEWLAGTLIACTAVWLTTQVAVASRSGATL